VPPPLRVCWYCPSHYRAWLVTAHKTIDTATIFSHLLSKARPIHGADVDAAGKRKRAAPVGGEGDENANALPKRPAAPSKRRAALARVINKANRKRRP